jgi:phage terminase large subunit-like protein
MTTSIAPNTPDQSTAGATAPRRVADLPPEQRPRFFSLPAGDLDFSLGDEAVELAERTGLKLDAWQAFALRAALARRKGKWAGFEVGVNVARQNGKGSILEARELAGLFLLGEGLIVHTAHEFPTSLEAFWRLLHLVEHDDDLAPQIHRVSRAHGEEGFELKSGQRIRFRTRTKGGGRGFSANCVIFDEAMFLSDTAIAALMPTLSAQSVEGDPQLWYTGSAVDQLTQEGHVFTRIRNRGIAGDDDLVYVEYSAEGELEDAEYAADDRAAWAAANPGLGIRISADHIAKERKSMDLRTFAVERLGIGDWPNVEEEDEFRIDPKAWEALADTSEVPTPLTLALDTRPDRSKTAIAAAGYAETGFRTSASSSTATAPAGSSSGSWSSSRSSSQTALRSTARAPQPR